MPRRNKFPDAILLAAELIYVIEFKVGAAAFDSAGTWQVKDYALDLRDFHLESRARAIIPILVATGAAVTRERVIVPDEVASVWPVAYAAPQELASVAARSEN